jgi:protein ImuB
MQSMWRIACVRIPRFPIAAAQRERADEAESKEAKGKPARSTRGPGISASNISASNTDMPNIDMSNTNISSARAASTNTSRSSLPWDDHTIARAAMEVTAALVAASPRVTPAVGETGIWWVGADGFDQLGGETRLAHTLLDIARRWSPRARVAVAGSCVAARAATWASARGTHGRDPVIVPAGGDAHYLSSAPLALIPMDAELRDALASLGIRTAGALAALEAEDVERRWGNDGLDAWRLARGHDQRRPVLARVESPRSVEAALPSPATTIEPLLFLVRAALDRLADELTSDGRSAASIAITLVLDDARSALPRGATPHSVTREVRLPRPTARAAHLFDHCRSLLERWPLGAPVSAVCVAVAASAPSSGEQGDLLSTAWRDAAAMDAALTRLRAELGTESVVRPVERDEHRPDQAGEWVAGDSATVRKSNAPARHPARRRVAEGRARKRSAKPTELPQRVLRLVEEPEPVEVELETKLGAEAPCAVWWRGQRLEIRRSAEPERLSGKWWDDDGAYRRDYWLCDSENGELLLFVDRAGGDRWYVQGWYD